LREASEADGADLKHVLDVLREFVTARLARSLRPPSDGNPAD